MPNLIRLGTSVPEQRSKDRSPNLLERSRGLLLRNRPNPTAGSPLPGGKEQTAAHPPAVTVVIPSRNRRLLLDRALRSVLGQTLTNLEVVVVIDGPDHETQAHLDSITDDRLHVLPLPNIMGGSEARNIGVRYARGKWIAFLDDDDEWMTNKLAAQIEIAEAAKGPRVFVASRFVERSEGTERVLPRRFPDAKEIFSDYMFSRIGWNSGEGFLQTSTWFVSRQLMIETPFTPGLKRCQDLDWLLHATSHPGVEVFIAPEVLAIFHHEERGDRVSRTADWKFLYDWATHNRCYFTPRAFSFFIATFCVPSASMQRAGLRTFAYLLGRCLAAGSSTPKCLALSLLCWFVPEPARRSTRRRLAEIQAFWMRRTSYGFHPPGRKKVA